MTGDGELLFAFGALGARIAELENESTQLRAQLEALQTAMRQQAVEDVRAANGNGAPSHPRPGPGAPFTMEDVNFDGDAPPAEVTT